MENESGSADAVRDAEAAWYGAVATAQVADLAAARAFQAASRARGAADLAAIAWVAAVRKFVNGLGASRASGTAVHE